MITPSLSDYTDLITSLHAGQAKFVASVEAAITPVLSVTDFVSTLPDAFDLDSAIGAQLDVVGAWAGISRYINVPIQTPWFSFDIANRGWDQGIWKGPFSAGSGTSPLDDATYRDLIRAKIACNAWDGTFETAKQVLDTFFLPRGVSLFVEDRRDMSVVFGFAGATPSPIILSVMDGGYLPLKPAGVSTKYRLSSVSNTPMFGFDMNNSNVAGWDVGSWGISPADIWAAA